MHKKPPDRIYKRRKEFFFTKEILVESKITKNKSNRKCTVYL